MPWVYRYEIIDPTTRTVREAGLMRTKETIRELGGRIIEGSGLEVDESEIVDHGAYLRGAQPPQDETPERV